MNFKPGDKVEVNLDNKILIATVINMAGCCGKVLIEFDEKDDKRYDRILIKTQFIKKVLESTNKLTKYPFIINNKIKLIDVRIMEEHNNFYILERLDTNQKNIIVPKIKGDVNE